MADTVTTQVIENGQRNLVVHFTNVSDGTGESGVMKIDATAGTYAVRIQGNTIPPGVHLKVRKVVYNVYGMNLRLLWDATVDQTFLTLNGFGEMCWLDTQGLYVPQSLAGATGSILFTTFGAALGSTYSVTLFMVKGVPQS